MRRLPYLIAFVALFLVEVAIALWAHGPLRGFVGDVLVVILIYCFVQMLVLKSPGKVILGVFLFACLIEALQAVDYAKLLGVADIGWLSIVLGRTASWTDILAYGAGSAVVVVSSLLARRLRISSMGRFKRSR